MSTNGFISMGEHVITDYPILPGTDNIVSPYGSNINTSLGGSVRYTEFTTDHPQMVRVSDFINEVTGHDFHGNTMMIVYWDSVGQGTIVSLLLASLSKNYTFLPSHFQYSSSTFQTVLITDGSASYAVLIYDCGRLGWTGATIGWSSTGSVYEEHPLSGSNSVDIDCEYSDHFSAVVYRLGKIRMDSQPFSSV